MLVQSAALAQMFAQAALFLKANPRNAFCITKGSHREPFCLYDLSDMSDLSDVSDLTDTNRLTDTLRGAYGGRFIA